MSDASYMKQALRLAWRGQGRVEPNPMVGCVIVRNGKVVGRGYHKRFGGAHAEVEALREAGKSARGATVYVTLEPCCHHGKTPPCTDALIAAGVKRVVIGFFDPTPSRCGVGVSLLEKAGIEVERQAVDPDAARLVEPFTKRVLTGLPFVIAKWAATIDGAIATRTGDSKWISNERSRRIVHQMRGRVDAVMVGISTVLADDPMLTARDVPVRRVARRLVVDPKLRTPDQCKLLKSLEEAPLSIAVAKSAMRAEAAKVKRFTEAGVEIVPLPMRGKRALDMHTLMKHMADVHDATNIMVEGGGFTIGSIMDENLVDELLVFIAPKLLGDPDRRSAVQLGTAAEWMSRAMPLHLRQVRRVGEDVCLRYRLQ
ncbi:MAG: bifunctional diaminohydroxyphosphoribosylaminopyrimidine deaminase/5-amino-6-(5-phosphoribosylamino)uracil reductase RibD [Planctomycetes bacterium]|nr:bifunctional diaminohydroxyphosphoribosylaminopyrimidine deaminase/5-amino-6-(5-phosphoribosylamino)uracil reductase RibD [Planctomycetota bacterium]